VTIPSRRLPPPWLSQFFEADARMDGTDALSLLRLGMSKLPLCDSSSDTIRYHCPRLGRVAACHLVETINYKGKKNIVTNIYKEGLLLFALIHRNFKPSSKKRGVVKRRAREMFIVIIYLFI
jgi:hypothetical protein